VTKPRKYTGNTDPHPKARPGTRQFQALMVFLFDMKNLGIYANRPVRGAKGLSVHATGRACDLGGTPKQCKEATALLNDFRYDLGIEAIHDYRGNYIQTKGFGAAYRCDRDAWRVYDKNTIGPGGNWVHYEITPELADNPAKVDAAFTKVLDKIAKALEGMK
jgi:hypothetical protein